jgi:signal transduction histidine kinase
MTTENPSPEKSAGNPFMARYAPMLLVAFLLITGVIAYSLQEEILNVVLLECVHAGVVLAILVACLVYQRRYPHIRQFGWNSIVWGIGLLFFGTLVDIIDNRPGYGDYGGLRVMFPFGSSWETAYLKKMIGYAAGISLFAYGFFRWIPWMIQTRERVQQLNDTLSATNRNLNRTLMSLDEHIESERVGISRELHDDVAQQLTYVNVQVQLCRRELETGDASRTRDKLEEIAANVSDSLKSVRRISSDLRPESLFSLGLIPALEQFIEKLQQQNPEFEITLEFRSDADETHTRFEKRASDHELLHLFRIVQEGIRNAVKHAGRGQIRVFLEELNTEDGHERLCVRIEDTGRGLPWREIPPDETLIQQGHLGIVGLKERVKELSGIFRLGNRPDGHGARLEIILG